VEGAFTNPDGSDGEATKPMALGGALERSRLGTTGRNRTAHSEATRRSAAL
jgi:hypothetical protein